MKPTTSTEDAISVALVRCTELGMFEGRPLVVTAQLEAAQVEITVLHRNGDLFALTHLTFCVPANSIEYTGELANLPNKSIGYEAN
jgi:hypothetical protein